MNLTAYQAQLLLEVLRSTLNIHGMECMLDHEQRFNLYKVILEQQSRDIKKLGEGE